MIKTLEKFDIIQESCEDYPWERFGLDEERIKYDEDLYARTIYPYVLGWCNGNKNGSVKYVLCCKDFQYFWFDIGTKMIKALKRWSDHIDERIEDGVSFRDAWNVDTWLADKCAKVISKLEKNTHSFPGECVKDLHEKVLAVEGRKLELTEEEKALSSDDLCLKWYHEDLKRMVFLFNEYDEDKCSQKNQYNFDLKIVNRKIKDGPHKGCCTIYFEGTDEQKAEADRYHKRMYDIEQYRIDCLHKAIAIMNIYIIHLWD